MPRDLVHFIESCDERDADFEIAATRRNADSDRRSPDSDLRRKVACRQVEHQPQVPASYRRRSRSRTPIPLRGEIAARPAQLLHEEIALVGAEHQNTAERIPLQ